MSEVVDSRTNLSRETLFYSCARPDEFGSVYRQASLTVPSKMTKVIISKARLPAAKKK